MKLKSFLIGFGAVLVICFCILFFLQFYVEHRVQTFIEDKIAPSVDVTYQEVDFNIFSRTVRCTGISATFPTADSTAYHTQITTEKVEISGIRYAPLFLKFELNIDEVLVATPIVTHHKHLLVKRAKKLKKKAEKKEPFPNIKINAFLLKNGQITLLDDKRDTTNFVCNNLNLQLSNCKVDSMSIEERIPFYYDNLSFQIDSVFTKAGKYEYCQATDLVFVDHHFKAENIKLYTKYNEASYEKILDKRRPHFGLTAKDVQLENVSYEKNKAGTLTFKSDALLLNQPYTTIHTNKQIPQNDSIKILYSEQIRKIKVAFGIEKVRIENGFIEYVETLENGEHGGILQFKNLYANILNLGNTHNQETTVEVDALFMEETPLKVNWSFTSADLEDKFVFKANLGELNVKHLNPFMVPNVNVSLAGMINAMDFTIRGNKETSVCDMEITCNDIKAESQDDKLLKKVAIGLLNIVILNGKGADNCIAKDCQSEVVRDKRTSYWNYVYSNVISSLKRCLVKKELKLGGKDKG